MLRTKLRIMLAAATTLGSVPSLAQSATGQTPAGHDNATAPTLEDQFRDPPTSARPRVWWHWMNGNITKDGIAKDLAWMKRVGIGGAQNFDANLRTPQIVDKRLVYMTPEWKDAFRFAASEADRQGLELAIASSPGWSETGGPWVKPEDGLKKLVWSETEVKSGRRLMQKLPSPPAVSGPYQSLTGEVSIGAQLNEGRDAPIPQRYADVAVLAYPVKTHLNPSALVTGTDGKPVDGRTLDDGDLESGIELLKVPATSPLLRLTFPSARTIRAATLFVPGVASVFTGASYLSKLEASDDGKAWREITDIPLGTVPTTIAFAPVTAREFRVVFSPAKSAASGFKPMAAGVDMMALAAASGSGVGGGPKPIRVTDFRLTSENRIDHAETKAGFSVAQDYYALSTHTPDTPGVPPGKVVNLTDRLRSDGTLDWTPPRLRDGDRWRIVRFGYSLLGTTNHPAPPEATGLEVDKYDGAAVRRYMEHYLGMYKDAAGPDLLGQHGVRALLTDSIEVGTANWTPQMISQFKRLRGYDPTPWLPALTGTIVGSRSQSDSFLYDYRRTLADLMASEHYATLAQVAHENGLKVYGEALEGHRPVLGDEMAMRRYADVPMAALWTYRRDDSPGLANVADMKGAASVAHVYGQNLVAAESMTAIMAPWAFGPNDLKRIIDLEFVTGVNRPVVHTSVHVPGDDKKPGLSLSMFGQYFNRNESWGELARPWIDYISRNSLMLQQGRNVADVAYFYGEEAPPTSLFAQKAVADAPVRYAYDYVGADVLMDALANDGPDLVSPGGARYRALYLGGSSRQMTLPVLRKLAQLVEGGGTVIGRKPIGDPSLSGDATEFSALSAKLWPKDGSARVGKGRVIASDDVEAALTQVGLAPDFAFSGAIPDADILFLHRQGTDRDTYFLTNRKDRIETIEARFRVTGKVPELWHAESGSIEAVSYRIENGVTIVPLTLAPDKSVHVVFAKTATALNLTVKKRVPVEIGQVAGAWRVTFEAGRGAPASAIFPSLAPLDESADPRIKYFSGIATYTNALEVPKSWRAGQPLWLDLGEAREIAEVRVNGKAAGAVWHAPYRLEIGKLVKSGGNRLEVRVANFWVNRLIGDAQPGASKVTWTALPTYTAKAPLRRSGLIGPVKLLK